jgi:large subunit ribosomal protein L6
MTEMPRTELVERTLEIPQGVTVTVSNQKVKVSGPKGTLEEDLSHLPCTIDTYEGRVRVRSLWPRKAEIAMTGTAAAKIRNMIKGVTAGFTFKMKVVHAHFPVTLKVKDKEHKLLIENFTGEKTARIVRIVGDSRVKVSGDEIVIEGISLQDVSQTAANIEQSTKIKDKDQRVFLDGIYVFERKEGM